MTARDSTFDSSPRAFGPFVVRGELGMGRFGPVFHAHDPERDRPVVVRTFTRPVDTEQRDALVEGLRWLCDTPLHHPSLARPLLAGIEGRHPFLVQEYLPGAALDGLLEDGERQTLAAVVPRIATIAAALDFAAAMGIHHGLMGPRDVILDGEAAGITGLGLVQALRIAGLDVAEQSPYASPQRLAGEEPTAADDVYSLAALTYHLLQGRPPRNGGSGVRLSRVPNVDADQMTRAFEMALDDDRDARPQTALQFVASLQAALAAGVPGELQLHGQDELRHVHPAEDTSLLATAADSNADDLPLRNRDEGQREPIDRFTVAGDFPDEFRASATPAAGETDSVTFGRLELAPEHFQSESEWPATESVQTPRTAVRGADEPRPNRLDRQEPVAFTREVDVIAPSSDRRPLFGHVPDDEARDRRSPAWLAAAALALGLLLGFAAGFSVGERRGELRVAERAVEMSTQSSAAVVDTPAATDGRTVDEATPASGGQDTATSQVPAAPVSDDDRRSPSGGGSPDASSPSGAVADSRLATPDARRPASDPRLPTPESSPVGRVLVRSIPSGATVVVDGEPRGVTPVAVRGLSLGSHVVELMAPGYPTRQEQVTLTAAQPASSLEITLGASAEPSPGAPSAADSGALQIDSRPSGAQVFVDNALVGTTPLLLPNVAVGSRAVRLEMPGYQSWATSVTVDATGRARVSASLQR